MGSGLNAPLPRDYLHALCQMVRLLAALGSLFLFQGGIAQLAAPVDAVLRFHPVLLLAALGQADELAERRDDRVDHHAPDHQRHSAQPEGDAVVHIVGHVEQHKIAVDKNAQSAQIGAKRHLTRLINKARQQEHQGNGKLNQRNKIGGQAGLT